MLLNGTTQKAALLSALMLCVAIAVPAVAKTQAKDATKGANLPYVEETVVVTEVDLQPVTLARKILESDAYMADGKKIGPVHDIVLDADNKATALVVGVGGFLGIDETYVAIPMSKVTFKRKGSNLKVIANVTQSELQSAKKGSS